MFVAGDVGEDRADHLVERNSNLDDVEEPDEVTAPAVLHGAAE